AEAHIVPVPAGPALVIARDFLYTERPALAELRRQHDWRKIGRKRLCQIDDPHATSGDEPAEKRMKAARGALPAGLLPGLCGHGLGSGAVSSRPSVSGLSR